MLILSIPSTYVWCRSSVWKSLIESHCDALGLHTIFLMFLNMLYSYLNVFNDIIMILQLIIIIYRKFSFATHSHICNLFTFRLYTGFLSPPPSISVCSWGLQIQRAFLLCISMNWNKFNFQIIDIFAIIICLRCDWSYYYYSTSCHTICLWEIKSCHTIFSSFQFRAY